MQLALLAVLLGLAICLIFLGYYSKERAYSLVGFSFFFILGFWVIMPAGIEYQSGQTEAYNYVCSACDGNSLPTLAGANSTHQISSIVTTNNYTAVNDDTTRFFGVWLALIGVIGAAITTAEIKRGFT